MKNLLGSQYLRLSTRIPVPGTRNRSQAQTFVSANKAYTYGTLNTRQLRLPSNIRPTTRDCMQWVYVWSFPVTWQRWRSPHLARPFSEGGLLPHPGGYQRCRAELYKFAIGEGHRQVIGAQQGKYVRSVRKSDSQRKKIKSNVALITPLPCKNWRRIL